MVPTNRDNNGERLSGFENEPIDHAAQRQRCLSTIDRLSKVS